jgi:cell wall-associated NlpC family hydrolase
VQTVRAAAALAALAFLVLILTPVLVFDGASSAALASPVCSGGPLVPTTGAYLGANTPAIGPTEAQTGAHLHLDRTFSHWDDPQPSRNLLADNAAGRLPALSIEPPPGADAAIAAGARDAAIRRQAAGIRAFGAPVLLSFDHEPEFGHRTSAADFIAAWRHYVDVFRAEGVTNVAWVPVLESTTFSRGQADAWYPGDGYVDWIGADGYNWAHSDVWPDAPWKAFRQVFSAFAAYGAGHRKPLLIGEFAAGDDPRDPTRKPAWIRAAAEQVKQWPQVKALSWFVLDRWEALTTDADQQAFADVAADPYFQAAPPTTAAPPTATGTLAVLDVARAAQAAGFTGENLVTAVAVGGAESAYDPAAVGHYPPHTYYGLWQIQDTHADLLAEYQPWSDPAQNARMAYAVWQDSGWAAWQTYVANTDQPYLAAARQAVAQLGDAGAGCADSTPGGGSGGQGAVTWALAHLNIPYLWGGCLEGVPSCGVPSPSGLMDCSGYTSAAWWFGAHVTLPRTSQEQWRAAAPIPAGQEQPGDLIFSEFGVDGPGHVMIVVTPGNPGVAAEEPHTGDVSKTISYTEKNVTFGRPSTGAVLLHEV